VNQAASFGYSGHLKLTNHFIRQELHMQSTASIPSNGFHEHIETLSSRYAAALEHVALDTVVLGSGALQGVFLDDQHYAFKANPHFLQWAPLQEHPDSFLIIKPGDIPRLLLLVTEDFWNLPPVLPTGDWSDNFAIETYSDPQALKKELNALDEHTAFIGPKTCTEDISHTGTRNPTNLLDYLHYHRAVKTNWEVDRIRRATAMAVPGHHAAKDAFDAGGNELDIYQSFMRGCGQTDDELPYPAIVALGEHAATLHYQNRQRAAAQGADAISLLIDAGCMEHGYASDITRSYSNGNGRFSKLLDGMDQLQQELCSEVKPGTGFGVLQKRAHLAIATLLKEQGVVNMDASDMLTSGVTQVFFPHGLGHFLGLQVHDVGGHLADPDGTPSPPPTEFPKLRLTRTLEPGNVLTIEPGLYFIEALLTKLRSKPEARYVDWPLVESLMPYGGIRTEDNLLVTEGGNENLTRQAFNAH
jgi:Xaa-Pro dipeptidase